MRSFIISVVLLSAGIIFYGCHKQETPESQTIKKPFKIALVQMEVLGGDRDRNLEHAREQIETAARDGADIVLLPEVMDLGWTHPSVLKLAEKIPGSVTFKRLAAAAKANNIYVCAGMVERDGELVFNSAVIIGPEGKEVLQGPYGAHADTIMYVDIETLERPARGTGWHQYWKSRQEKTTEVQQE